tara:strand:+ start:434 stop:856 length:423 start_codon:yes stop_codon:yes gene_type:complete
MRKFLYFRNVADQDDDDSFGSNAADSLLISSEKLIGFIPQAHDTLRLLFECVLSQFDHNGVILRDHVDIEITRHRHKEVMEDIVNAINRSQNGIIIIADDVTTTYLTNPTGPADETVVATYLGSNITGCSAISIADAAAA